MPPAAGGRWRPPDPTSNFIRFLLQKKAGCKGMTATTSTPDAIVRQGLINLTLTAGAQQQQVLKASMNNRKNSGGGVRKSATTKQSGSTRTNGTSTTGRPNHKGSQRGSASQGFQSLDQQIFHLDASYDLLPDKTPWETYEANIGAEWELCASCAPGVRPKKLFRQYNLNRSTIGIPAVTIPIDITEVCHIVVTAIELTNLSGVFVAVLRGDMFGDATGYLFPRIGLVGGNPLLEVTAATFIGNYPIGSNEYNFCAAVVNQIFPGMPSGVSVTDAPVCVFTPNGAPGDQSRPNVELINI